MKGECEAQQTKQNVRRRKKKSCPQSRDAIFPPAGSSCRDDSNGNSDQPGTKHCDDRQHQGIRGACLQHGPDRGVICERESKLSTSHRPQPEEVSHSEGTVQSVLRSKGSKCVWRNLRVQPHLLEVLSRSHVHKDEREYRHSKHQK